LQLEEGVVPASRFGELREPKATSSQTHRRRKTGRHRLKVGAHIAHIGRHGVAWHYEIFSDGRDVSVEAFFPGRFGPRTYHPRESGETLLASVRVEPAAKSRPMPGGPNLA